MSIWIVFEYTENGSTVVGVYDNRPKALEKHKESPTFRYIKEYEVEGDKWFSEVRWYEEDLVNALEVMEYPVTEENIAILRKACEQNSFIGVMIEAGWEYIYNKIERLCKEEN